MIPSTFTTNTYKGQAEELFHVSGAEMVCLETPLQIERKNREQEVEREKERQ